ncbi:MAG: hypothetical protein ACXWTP_00885 [Methylosarcina sp.]
MPEENNNYIKKESHRRLVITDVDIPFMSMVILIFKWTFAAVPTAILLWSIFSVITDQLEKKAERKRIMDTVTQPREYYR